MSIDMPPEERVRRGLRAYLDAVPVHPPLPAALRSRAERAARAGTATTTAARRWMVPALAAVAVLSLLAGVAVLAGWPAASPVDPATGEDLPVLPERIAGKTWRTGLLHEAPPGAALAIFTHGTDRTVNEPVLLAADGRTYRTVDAYDYSVLSAARRLPPLLSPDGTMLAGVGGRIIDLHTGQVRRHQILPTDTEERWSISEPLAWSADSRWLVFGLAADDVPRPLSSRRDGGGLALLDTHRDEVSYLDTNAHGEQRAAFSPDGSEIVVSTLDDDQSAVMSVYARTGELRRELPLAPWQALLPNGVAWSPDGALLAVQGSGQFGFIDATGAGVATPEPFAIDDSGTAELLGWRGPDRVLVAVRVPDGGPRWLLEEPVIGPPLRTGGHVVSEFAVGDDRIADVRFASGLLAAAQLGDPGSPRHGPMPSSTRNVIASFAVGVGLLALALGWLLHPARRRSRA